MIPVKKTSTQRIGSCEPHDAPDAPSSRPQAPRMAVTSAWASVSDGTASACCSDPVAPAGAATQARRPSTAADTRMVLQGSRMSWLVARVKARSATSTLVRVRVSRQTRKRRSPLHSPTVWHQTGRQRVRSTREARKQLTLRTCATSGCHVAVHVRYVRPFTAPMRRLYHRHERVPIFRMANPKHCEHQASNHAWHTQARVTITHCLVR